MLLANKLQEGGSYRAALDAYRLVYDFDLSKARGSDPTTPHPGGRKVYYGLVLEESLPAEYDPEPDWLLDPMDPHSVAASRPHAYTRFTIYSIVQCLLDFADAEFTRDTSESLAQATLLYESALALLEAKEVQAFPDPCERLIERLVDFRRRVVVDPTPVTMEVGLSLAEVSRVADEIIDEHLNDAELTLEEASTAFFEAQTNEARATILNDLATGFQALTPSSAAGAVTPTTYGQLLESDGQIATAAVETQAVLLSQPAVAHVVELNGQAVSEAYIDSGSALLEDPDVLITESQPGIWNTQSVRYEAVNISVEFCLPQNPVLEALRLQATLNLHKIRTCRNIAGLEREVEPYSAPTDAASAVPSIGAGGQLNLPGAVSVQPTEYRYDVLVGRAKELLVSARQLESEFLRALERYDEETYRLIQARQGIELGRARVRLQRLRLSEAQERVQLATLQKERANDLANHYDGLISSGLLLKEQNSLNLLIGSASLQGLAALTSFIGAALPSSVGATGATYSPQGAAGATASAISSLAGVASTTASILSTEASYERREQEWELQKTLALKDSDIGQSQINIANDQVRIVGQEHEISELEVEHAEEFVEFLTSKETNRELYRWMSRTSGSRRPISGDTASLRAPRGSSRDHWNRLLDELGDRIVQ
jgi:hypothetical protein